MQSINGHGDQITDEAVRLAMEYTAQQRMLLECVIELWLGDLEEYGDDDNI